MDDFNVPILAESSYTATINNNTGANNNNNQHHHQQHHHHHHHKDQMLAAGNTPTTPFITTNYTLDNNKDESIAVKNDYSTFTNCIQTSALLDNRVVEANIDGVSLGGLCDFKFPSPTSDSNFKTLTLMGSIEASSVLGGSTADKSQTNTTIPTTIEPVPSFTNLLFGSRADNSINMEAKIIQQQQQSCLPTTTTTASTITTTSHYHTMKPLEADTSFMSNQQQHHQQEQQQQQQQQQQQTVVVATTPSNCDTNLISFEVASTTTNNNNNVNSAQQTVNHNGLDTSEQQQQIESTPNNMLNNNNTNNLADNHITTTTIITNTANNHHNSSNSRSTLHSIEELAASSCTNLIATVPNNSNNNNNNNNNNTTQQQLIIDTTNSTNNHHNLSNLSSECDSLSSQDEFIELENSEQNGYQDNTSSHSQQSGGGGGGGTSANSNASSVALLNGGGGVGGVNTNAATSGGYMSLLPPAANSSGHLGGNGGGGGGTSSGTSATAGGTGEAIDFKHLFEELCPVCGDKVSGYHYGLLTCESCKGFFKRTVQNKKVYTCVAERSCHIDKTQRKRCPYCRFQKCLEVGMKLEAVRADRMRGGRNKFGPMYKRDRARKLQVMRQRQLALQALRTSIGSADMKATPLSPGYQQAYPNMNIKQEIQIPQVSSLTQSPDSSPSPIAIALGQVNASTGVITTPMNGNSGGGGSAGGGSGNNNSSNNSNNSDIINRGSNSNCHDAGTGSLQNATESKLCFDSGTHPSSTADSIEPLRVSPMIRDFVQSIDDREWQTQLFALLQKQTYNQVEVDLFELMCKVLDQNLFSQVDWARNTVFFKDLKVDDQMKLLQHSWSDMLVLDHLHQRIHNNLPDETQLNNGQMFNLLSLGLLGVPQLSDYFNELQNKLQDLKFDMGDYVCMKFLILLNPDVRGIINKKTVLEGHENVQAALLDYTLTCYPSVTDKFRRLLNILPEIHAMAARGEEHLYSKHCAGSAPTQTLLMEMLHAKRKG